MSALRGGHRHPPRTVSPEIRFPWRQHSIARYRTKSVSSGAPCRHVEGANQLPVGGDGPQAGSHWAIELDDPKSSLSALQFVLFVCFPNVSEHFMNSEEKQL